MVLKKNERANKARIEKKVGRDDGWMVGMQRWHCQPGALWHWLRFHGFIMQIHGSTIARPTVYTLNFLCPTIDSCLKGKSSGIAPYATIEKQFLLCQFVNLKGELRLLYLFIASFHFLPTIKLTKLFDRKEDEFDHFVLVRGKFGKTNWNLRGVLDKRLFTSYFQGCTQNALTEKLNYIYVNNKQNILIYELKYPLWLYLDLCKSFDCHT
jgi:hypothetical protein